MWDCTLWRQKGVLLRRLALCSLLKLRGPFHTLILLILFCFTYNALEFSLDLWYDIWDIWFFSEHIFYIFLWCFEVWLSAENRPWSSSTLDSARFSFIASSSSLHLLLLLLVVLIERPFELQILVIRNFLVTPPSLQQSFLVVKILLLPCLLCMRQ